MSETYSPLELSEIDKEVAEAIGGWIEEQAFRMCWVFELPNGRWMPTVSTPESHEPIYDDESRNAFRPSSEWDDAMWALEKVANGKQIKVDNGNIYHANRKTGWAVCIDCRYLAECEESGPIAICKAIIAYKQSEKDL